MTSRVFLLPLLLTGCQMHTVSHSDTPPAQQTVDTLLQTSLNSVAQAQQELARHTGVTFTPVVPVAPAGTVATPSPVRKIPPAAVTHPLPSPPHSIAGLTHLHYTGTPDALPALVSRDGHTQALDTALKAIVPAGWSTVQSADVRHHFTAKVSWRGGDQWPHVLDTLAGDYHLDITVMWASKQVTVAQRVNTPASGIPATPAARPVLSSQKAGTTRTPTTVPAPAPVKIPPPVKAAVPASLPPAVWKADTGQTLKDVLFAWSAAADCHGKHWTVDWVTQTNYRIDAPLQFTGDYREALNSIFGLYMSANVPLYAGTSTPQCLLKVDDKPVR